MTIAFLLIFWAMQIAAGLLFKYGATSPERWLLGIVVGNVFGAGSIWFYMKLQQVWNPNVAAAICVGGAFLLVQLGLLLVFRATLSVGQWFGILAIAAGMAAVSLTGKVALN